MVEYKITYTQGEKEPFAITLIIMSGILFWLSYKIAVDTTNDSFSTSIFLGVLVLIVIGIKNFLEGITIIGRNAELMNEKQLIKFKTVNLMGEIMKIEKVTRKEKLPKTKYKTIFEDEKDMS